MKKMSEFTKAMLRVRKADERAKIIKAKDLTLTDWLMASDRVKELLPDLMEHPARFWEGPYPQGRTFRYIPRPIIRAIAETCPVAFEVQYKSGPDAERRTWLFPEGYVRQILTVLGLDYRKYSSLWVTGLVRQHIKFNAKYPLLPLANPDSGSCPLHAGRFYRTIAPSS